MHSLPPSFSRSSKILAALFAALAIAGCSAESKRARLLERADRYFEAGDYEEAKIVYFNLLREDPQSAPAMGRIGIIWFEQGAPFRAFPFLLKARDLDPENPDVRMKLALAFMSTGQIAEARKETEAILQRFPAHEEAILNLAESALTTEDIEATQKRLDELNDRTTAGFHLASASLAFRRGDQVSGENSIKEAMAADPELAAAHLAVARLHASREEFERAREAFKTASSLAPLRSLVRLKYAEFEALRGNVSEARTILEELTSKAPDYFPAWKLLAQIALAEKDYEGSLGLLNQVFSRDATNYEARVLQAQILLAKGEAGKAVESLKHLETTYAGIPAIKLHLARAHLQNAEPDRALLALNEAVKMNPDYLEAALLLGELKLRNGEAQPVVDAMKGILEKQPGLIQAQLILAAAFRSLGLLDEAAGVYRRQIEASPEKSQPHFMLGLILRQQGRISEARESLEKAQQLAPESLLPSVQLVELDMLDKEFDSALERVRRHLEHNPESADAHFLRGRIHTARSEWDLAETDLLKSLELNPNSSSAYALLINAYIAANKLPQAVSRLEEVLTKSPGNLRALMTLALIHERTNQFAKSRDAYEEILSAKPDFGPALNNLAYIYAERLNDLDRAYELAIRARSLEPEDGAIADTLGWIHYRRQEYDQASILLQESAEKLPNNPEVQFHLGMTNYMMGRSEAARTALRLAVDAPAEFPGKADARRRLALLEDGGRSADLSTGELESLLKEHPNDPVALMRLGESYEREQASAKAAESYKRALKLNPSLLDATLKLARLNAGPLDNREEALEFAKRARELAPNDAEAAAILGEVAYQSQNFTWAYSLLQESARRLADDAAVLHNFGWAAYSIGRVDEAREIMQRVTESAPDSSQSAGAAAFLSMTTPDPEKIAAVEGEAEALLEREPDYVPALMVRAFLRQRENKPAAAVDAYEKALQRFPDFTPAQKHLAALYADIPDKLDEAYDLALNARKVLQSDAELARTLGELSYRKGNYSYASQLLEESGRKQPLDAEGLFYLGTCRLRLDQGSDKGGDALRESVRAGLKEPFLSEARSALAKLENK